jgi:hypothetical protein
MALRNQTPPENLNILNMSTELNIKKQIPAPLGSAIGPFSIGAPSTILKNAMIFFRTIKTLIKSNICN